MPAPINLTGRRFGRLVALHLGIPIVEYPPSKPKGREIRTWVCRCDCGGAVTARAPHLLRLKNCVRSCGCWNKEIRANVWRVNYRHGHSRVNNRSTEYSIWAGIKTRCTNPNANGYENYGGRGIAMCPEWLDSFETFYEDMGPRPSSKHTVERVSNGGPYAKANCEWALRAQQSLNTRRNRRITIDGVTLTAMEWDRRMGHPKNTVGIRIRELGWSPEKAVLTPVRNLQGSRGANNAPVSA